MVSPVVPAAAGVQATGRARDGQDTRRGAMTTDTISRFYEAEAKCMHCGRLGGLMRSARPATLAGAVFAPAGGGRTARIDSLADVRCAQCGGPLYAEAFEPRYAFKPADLPIDQPRRGRPPRWLVEARRRAAEELGACDGRASSA